MQPLISLVKRDDKKLLQEYICENCGEQSEKQGLGFHQLEYNEKIEEIQVYLDMVKEKVRPGCSLELLNIALTSMSSIARFLTVMAATSKLHAAL